MTADEHLLSFEEVEFSKTKAQQSPIHSEVQKLLLDVIEVG